jgi:hypothetical protein
MVLFDLKWFSGRLDNLWIRLDVLLDIKNMSGSFRIIALWSIIWLFSITCSLRGYKHTVLPTQETAQNNKNEVKERSRNSEDEF